MLARLKMLQSLLVRQQMCSIWLQSNIALTRVSVANMHADKVVMHYRCTKGMDKIPSSDLLIGLVQALLNNAMQMVLR